MDSYHLCATTATIKFSDLYWSEEKSSYRFDVTFENSPTNLLPNLISNPAGFDAIDFSENYLKYVKKTLQTAYIYNGHKVSILFTENKILAIGTPGRDLWIDVRNGICGCPYPKSFLVLDFKIKSLEVY